MTTLDHNKIPEYVKNALETLRNAGFECFIVGGCVRDLILGREPKDWDITTNATPEEIIALFPKTVYENSFGTVAVVFEDESSKLKVERVGEKAESFIIEITPYRTESGYSDNRHPDKIEFAKTLSEDLKRRDFTMNALAYDLYKGHLVDEWEGLSDIKDKVIRTVGDAGERFKEDALRMARAVRFSTQLGFAIDGSVLSSISENKDLIKNISAERIRDEFEKIIMSDQPVVGIGLLQKLGLLTHIIPELEEGVGCEQKGEHIYDVFEHVLHALGHASEKKWPLHIRLSALFHDIGKPRTRRWDGTKAGGAGKYTFYGHEVVGAHMTKKIMDRMKFPKDITEIVVKFVRYHMFFSDTKTITLSAVRRTIVNIGREHIWELMEVRECDRVGMKKNETSYRLRKYHAMIEEALRAPTSVGMLKINGEVLIKELGIKPGPRMGWILHALLDECLEDDTKNNSDYLKSQTLKLNSLSDSELKELGEKGKDRKEEVEEGELKGIRKKHGV
ncbi:MAG: CCA tRNA nucleotidyltransferase [Candidatus Pacebacteria bacterium]|nr:CCA tRNA nucleotidyltransferase [Candidatus Paceibacterota bacterium]MBP9780766.1 CCA tRNA nucleotidyltransferase [Candidatus Paceibacterota bacterium]